MLFTNKAILFQKSPLGPLYFTKEPLCFHYLSSRRSATALIGVIARGRSRPPPSSPFGPSRPEAAPGPLLIVISNPQSWLQREVKILSAIPTPTRPLLHELLPAGNRSPLLDRLFRSPSPIPTHAYEEVLEFVEGLVKCAFRLL